LGLIRKYISINGDKEMSNCRKCGKEASITRDGLGTKCAAAYYKGLIDEDKRKTSNVQSFMLRNSSEDVEPSLEKGLTSEEIKSSCPEETVKISDSPAGSGLRVRNNELLCIHPENYNQRFSDPYEKDSSSISVAKRLTKIEDILYVTSYSYTVFGFQNVKKLMISGNILSSVVDYRPSIQSEIEFTNTNPISMPTDPGRADTEYGNCKFHSPKAKDIKSITFIPQSASTEIMLTDAESMCSLDTIRKLQSKSMK
jgi:hypothetical protein